VLSPLQWLLIEMQCLFKLVSFLASGAISWFFNQDPEDWVIFLALFLLFAAMYFYFRIVVGELTLILILGLPTLSFF
jgi:hypothetical protein